MAGPPAACTNPACGHIFEVKHLIGGSGIVNFKLGGGIVSCEKCGQPAQLGGGEFKYQDGRLLLQSGPAMTRMMLDRLADIAEKAQEQTIKAEDLLKEISGVSPELAEKIRKRGLPAFLIVLLLFWFIKSVNLSITVDVNKLIDQVEEIGKTHSPDEILNAPFPNGATVPNELQNSTVAVRSENQPSRQVRRQLERQSKKQRGATGNFA